jgi:hypothetical protein
MFGKLLYTDGSTWTKPGTLSSSFKIQILRTFTTISLKNVHISYVVSVCPYATIQEVLKEFSSNLILDYYYYYHCSTIYVTLRLNLLSHLYPPAVRGKSVSVHMTWWNVMPILPASLSAHWQLSDSALHVPQVSGILPVWLLADMPVFCCETRYLYYFIILY